MKRALSQYEQVRLALLNAGTGGLHQERLRAMLWPDTAPQYWRVILAICVTKMRKDGMKVVCENSCYRYQPQENIDGQVAATA